MIKKIVFLWDSTIESRQGNVRNMKRYLTVLRDKGLRCESIDTRDIPEEELEYWRKEALVASVWRRLQIRRHFGASQLHLGKQVPTLLVYEEGEKVATAVYPHTKKRGQKQTDYSIEGFLKELADSLGG